MKNIEKYPKTADAVIAYRAYRAADIQPLTFLAWADADESLVANPPGSESPASDRSAPYLASGVMGLAALIAPLLAGGTGRNKVECGVDTSGGESVHVLIDIEHTTGGRAEKENEVAK